MKFFDKGELNLLWPFYLEYLIASSIFFASAFLVVYLSNLGLSFFQIGILSAIPPLTSLIFEIPTGAIADLYGRKFSVLCGYILEGICMLLIFFMRSYPALLAIFALWGIAMTFSSGSKDAWIVDLINKKNKKLVHNFFNKMQIFISLGLIFSGILGAIFVKQFGLGIIWLMTALSYLSSIVLLSIFAKEEYARRKIKIKDSFIELFKQSRKSIKYSYRHPVLFYFIVAGIVGMFAGSFQSIISWTPFMKGLGMPDYMFGYVFSAIALVYMISPFLSSKFLKSGKERNFIMITTFLWAIFTIFLAFAFNLFLALTFFLIGVLFYGAKKPVERVYFHRFVPTKQRATIGSIENMLLSFSSIVALPLAGFLIEKIGAKYTILISGILTIPVILIYSRIKEKRQIKNKRN